MLGCCCCCLRAGMDMDMDRRATDARRDACPRAAREKEKASPDCGTGWCPPRGSEFVPMSSVGMPAGGVQ